jgi:hypothetical protein
LRKLFENFSQKIPKKNDERKKHKKTPSITSTTKAIAIVGIGLVALFCSTTTMYAPLKNFVDVVTTASSYGINSATPDLQMQVLTINRNFPAGKPTVTLGNGSLNVCDQCYTATSISATLQNPDPATYVVTVRFGNSSVFQIDVTIPSPPPRLSGAMAACHMECKNL